MNTTRTKYDEHAELVGHVTLAWSNVHSVVFDIFNYCSGTDFARAQAIFFALRADSSQRDITLAVIKENASENLYRKASALFGKIAGLAGGRNAAAHTLWVTRMPEEKITPHPYVKQRGVEDDFVNQFEALVARLKDTFRDLMALHQEIIDERLANTGSV